MQPSSVAQRPSAFPLDILGFDVYTSPQREATGANGYLDPLEDTAISDLF